MVSRLSRASNGRAVLYHYTDITPQADVTYESALLGDREPIRTERLSNSLCSFHTKCDTASAAMTWSNYFEDLSAS